MITRSEGLASTVYLGAEQRKLPRPEEVQDLKHKSLKDVLVLGTKAKNLDCSAGGAVLQEKQ